MFDISLAELIVVGIVALIVIGPERLPAVARTAGYFLGRARRYVDQVKHDLHKEMELDNLKKLRDSMHETVNSFENSVRSEINKIQETTETQSTTIPDKQPSFEKPAENIEPVNNTSETKTSSAPAEPRQPNS